MRMQKAPAAMMGIATSAMSSDSSFGEGGDGGGDSPEPEPEPTSVEGSSTPFGGVPELDSILLDGKAKEL